MPILYCALDLYLPYCHSLKEKRKVIKGTAEKLRARFKVAVSELDHQDLWQRGKIGIVAIGPDISVLDQLAGALESESQKLLGGDLTTFTSEIIPHD